MGSPVERSVGAKAMLASGYLLVWQMLSRSLGFISTLVLARLLVPADFGLVAMAGAFAAAIDGLAQFNPGTVLLRQHEDDLRLHDTVFTLQMVRSAVTGGIVALSAPLASSWFSEPRLSPMLWVLGGLIALSGLQNVGTIEFQQTLRYDRTVRMLVLPRVLQVIATIAVAWFTRSYWALLAGIAVGRISQVATTYAMHPYRPRPSLRGWREVAGFSFWLWADSMGSLVWARTATFIVGPVFGSAGLGLFRIGGDVGLLPVTEFIAPISDVLLSSQALLERRGTRSAANVLPVALALLMLVAPLAISLSAGSGYVVALLLGAKWRAAQPLVQIMAWASLFAPFGWVSAVTLIAQGRVRQRFFVTGTAAVVQVPVLYFAALTHRLSLVAIGSVACLAFETLLFGFLLRPGIVEAMRGAAGGLARIALASVVSAAAVSQTGFAWRPESHLLAGAVGPLQAIVPSLVIGGTVFATFGGALLLSWVALGRPDGPEQLIGRLVGRLLPARIPGLGGAP